MGETSVPTSCRALARVLGVSKSTAARDMRAAGALEPTGYHRGLDGKEYPNARGVLVEAIINVAIEHPDWSVRRIAAEVGAGSPATVLRWRELARRYIAAGRSPVPSGTPEQVAS